MNIMRILVVVGLFLFVGCNRSGDDTTSKSLATNGYPNGGRIAFDVITKTNTLEDISGGTIRDRGHYSMIFQAKTQTRALPLSGLTNDSFYTMYESDIHINESKLRVSQDSKTVSNKILLLLDFSGSIIDDCSKGASSTDPQNLCYQIVNSSKQFIDKIISDNQTMAIYYFNSKNKVQALWRSPDQSDTTNDVSALKASLEKLYDASWRETNLVGYNSTNLYGAVTDATTVVCRWFDDCVLGQSSSVGASNQQNYDFATIVVFTDGQDTAFKVNSSKMLSELGRYKRNYYYTIGLGDVNDEVLEQIGKDGYLKATQTDKLDVAFNNLGEQLSSFANSFYKIDYCPAQQGGTLDLRIDVDDKKRKFAGQIKDTVRLIDGIDFR